MDEDLEDWDNFQVETDKVRHRILSYLTLKCEYKDKEKDNTSQNTDQNTSEQKQDNNNITAYTFHKLECEKYHNEDEKRRKPFKDGKLIYSSGQCEYLPNCIKGVTCNKSHNIFEILYHPALYRTSPCLNNCTGLKSQYCSYVHSQDELRTGSIYLTHKNANANLNTDADTNTNTNKLKENYNYNSNNNNYNNLSNVNLPKRFSDNFLISMNFDLTTFKTTKCHQTIKHNEKQCLGYHSTKDKRRSLNNFNYSHEMCTYAESDKNCINADYCLKSHNKVEMFYHPLKFKTKFCSHFHLDNLALIAKCSYGPYCSFAHSEGEIKIELIHRLNKNEDFFTNHFKTIVCPFTHVHEKAVCVYSHNWQDYRRDPLKFVYRNHSCPKWDNKKTILHYNEGCPDDYNCLLCHGWKEEDFHPLNYKTRRCKNFNKLCEKKEFCPFLHDCENKRKISQHLKEDFDFKLKMRKDNLNFNIPNSNNNNNSGNNKNSGNNNFNYTTTSNKNNRSEIINMNMNINITSPLYTSVNSLIKNLNINSKSFIPNQNKNKSFTGTFNYKKNLSNFNSNYNSNNSQNYSPNYSYKNSYAGGNLSDNDNDLINLNTNNHSSNKNSNSNTNTNNILPRSSNTSLKSNKYTHSPRFSSSSSENFTDNFTENSFRYESAGGINMINPDDSIEFANDKFDFSNKDFSNANNDKVGFLSMSNMDNLDRNNYLLKQLLKESDLLLSENIDKRGSAFSVTNNGNTSKEDFMTYLLVNNFHILYEKLNSGEIDVKNLIKLSDDLILLYVEKENEEKFCELRSILMKLDSNMDGEDLLKYISCDYNLNEDNNY